MIEQRSSKLNSYFDKKILSCEQRNKKLLADDRADEADFEKIRANVYDIFRTIFSVAVEKSQGDAEAVKRFFLSKIEQIPSNWVIAYHKARQHDDAARMKIEQIKLDTVDEIKGMFATIWEVSVWK